MRVAIYGRSFELKYKNYIVEFFNKLNNLNVEIIVYTKFYDFLIEKIGYKPQIHEIIDKNLNRDSKIDFVFSIGGDGTILDAVTFVRNTDIPVIGINTGKLGFLADIAIEAIPEALQTIFEKKYSIDERILLRLESPSGLFDKFSYGLNEITVQKKSSTMIRVKTYINNEFLNTYRADGLIVSTPTGSTAYSLSVGGPILIPELKNFILSPISPHNLTVRPIVIPDNSKITLKLDDENVDYLVSIDHRSKEVHKPIVLEISKAEFKLKLIKLEGKSFYSTLRNKLMWGADIRN